MIDIRSLPPIVLGEPFGAGMVDLWCFFHDGVPLAHYEALLTEDERERHERYRFQRDRDTFLATRALVRTVLSNYAAVAPADWRFAIGETRKPSVAGRDDLVFNLTNTRGLVACAVAGHGELGVDAERIEHRGDLDAVARRFFAPQEASTAHDLDRFFEIWTLKESYLKARGVGLSVPLDQFWFDLGAAPRIHFGGAIGDSPHRWRFASIRLSPEHIVAVASDTGGAPLRVRAARTIPLQHDRPF